MIYRLCLGGCGTKVPRGRCRPCRARLNRMRNTQPERAIYSGSWAATSRKAREAQPWCSVCFKTEDLTLDHTTGYVICRRCHLSEANGGVFRAVADRQERVVL